MCELRRADADVRMGSRGIKDHKYPEPTPAWMHSYGLDSEGNLKRGDLLQKPREKTLATRVIKRPSTWSWDLGAPTMHKSGITQSVVMDVSDPCHHKYPEPAQTENQSYGWWADPKRIPQCKLRDWPANRSHGYRVNPVP